MVQVKAPHSLAVPLAHAVRPMPQASDTQETDSTPAAVKKGRHAEAATVGAVALDAPAALAEMRDMGVGLVDVAWVKSR